MALTKVGKEGITGITNASDATAITISSSENVGIGTASPSTQLHIENSGGNASAQLTSGTSGTSFINMGDTGDADIGQISYLNSANAMAFTANAAERMRIDSSGNVFIAKTAAAFGTAGHELRASGLAVHTVSGNTVMEINRTTNTGTLVGFNADGVAKGSISTDGSSTAYNTSSDYRLKENVVYDWDATTRLKQLKPARFNFIIDADKTVDGFLAHEAQAVVPNSVTGTKDEVDEDGVAVMQSIDNSKLVPLLVKTIQELEARLTAGGL